MEELGQIVTAARPKPIERTSSPGTGWLDKAYYYDDSNYPNSKMKIRRTSFRLCYNLDCPYKVETKRFK